MKIISRLTIIFITFVIAITYNLSTINDFEIPVDSRLNNDIELPIIMYHAILKDENSHGKFVISPTQFENDIKFITENGYEPILISDLLNYVNGEKTLPKKPIIITFDDGYYNNYLYAFPILKKYNAKAVISIIGKYSELYSNTNEKNAYYTHITWEQCKEMTESNLIEIQNHTYDLHNLTSGRKGIKKLSGENLLDYQKMLYADLHKTHDLITKNLGVSPTAIAFPFGYYCDEADNVIEQLGYKASFSSTEGINIISPTQNLHQLKRYNRPHGISSEDFFKNILK